MKLLLVKPSRLIKFNCPYCKASGQIKRETEKFEDFVVRCPKCKEKTYIKKNARRFYRKDFSKTVCYSISEIKKISDSRARKGKIINISKGGFLAEISPVQALEDNYEQEGNILTFLFPLGSNDEIIRVSGKIKKVINSPHRLKTQIGVEFVRLGEYPKKQIGFFLLT